MRTIAAPAGVEVTVDAPLEHYCPIVDEIDVGSIRIKWRCVKATLELHALRAYLDSWKDVTVSHEEMVEAVTVHLAEVPDITAVEVKATFTTAGMTVTASA